MQAKQSTLISGSSLWALLIGINEYKAGTRLTQLNGCINDVEAMRTFLINQLGVPENHIRMLTNEQATRTAILQAFKEFLIENPNIAFNDQMLFHYSGHGSQMPDMTGVEPDGYNETIVPYDSRTPGVYDIRDKTLAALLALLAQKKGDRITVILDSCHSGSGTRKIDLPGTAPVRQIPPDDRLPPADLDAELLRGVTTRGAGPSGWDTSGVSHVLLAGCRDHELSNEYWGKSESQQGVWHGALTYFTLQALRQMAPGTIYAELHEQVAAQVNAIYRNQTPQCEGDRERVVFGGLRVQRNLFITVEQVSENTVTLGAGLVHGLREGTQLALYPPNTRTREHLPPAPLATIEVVQVGATRALARLLDEPAQAILLHARGLITQHVYIGLSQTLALRADEGEENQQALARLRQAIEQATPDGKPSPYLQIVSEAGVAQMYVLTSAGKLSIYNANGELLVEPTEMQTPDESDALSVLHALESIVRYRTVLALTNEGQISQLVGKVKLRLRHHVPGKPASQAQALPSEAISPGGELTVYFYPDQPERNRYVVDVINESPFAIYPHVFTLSPDYSIQRLYPRFGQQETIQPGGTFVIPDLLKFYLPTGWDASRDYLKLLVTAVPTDLQALEQKGLNVPPAQRDRSRVATKAPKTHLDKLLEVILYEPGKRFAGPDDPPPEEDWAVEQLSITTVRAFGTVKLDVPAGDIALSDGISLIKPEGFQGQVTVTTWGQASRGADGDPGLQPPPGLAHFPDFFQPVERVGTRGIGPAGLVVAFDVDDTSRQHVTPDNPLYLKLSPVAAEEGGDLLAIAFDGEDYMLVGSSAGTNTVQVGHLPATVGGTTRGMRHAIKLFLYKKMGRFTAITGLHRAELNHGKVVYSEVQRDQFQPGQHVAVFVHGFTSDTRWMIQGLAQFLREEVLPYNHLLTWDYESFGTSIKEIGTELARSLRRQCGFGPDDGITVHIYAHSMGCLVSRYLIEMAGGDQFVDRLVMAGPPNQGTTLANLSRGFVYITNALINRYSVIPPLGAIDWATKELYAQGKGWADLVVNSQVIQDLNALEKPPNVPYLVLVGENVQDEQERSRVNRLAKKVLHDTLDGIFGEPNDTVIGVSSMKGLRGDSNPAPKLDFLPCDHFHYYDIPQGLGAVKHWILGRERR